MIKYPYTDFHEMNLDWLLQQMKELNERMDNFVTEITADIIPIVQQAIEEGLIDVTYDSTNETVVLVPGAGVTSQHLAKFFQISGNRYPVADETAREDIRKLSAFVTPEMFGAVGDGVADDTAALQSAFNSDLPVVFPGKYMFTDTLTLDTAVNWDDKKRSIDFNGAQLTYTGIGFAIEIGANAAADSNNRIEQRLERLYLKCPNGSGIKVYNFASYVRICDSTIVAHNIGVMIGNPNAGVSTDALIERCIIENTPRMTANSVGIQVNTYDNSIINTRVYFFKKQIESTETGAGLYMSLVHSLSSYPYDSVFFYDNSQGENYILDCYSDTDKTIVGGGSNSGVNIVNNIHYYSYSATLTDQVLFDTVKRHRINGGFVSSGNITRLTGITRRIYSYSKQSLLNWSIQNVVFNGNYNLLTDATDPLFTTPDINFYWDNSLNAGKILRCGYASGMSSNTPVRINVSSVGTTTVGFSIMLALRFDNDTRYTVVGGTVPTGFKVYVKRIISTNNNSCWEIAIKMPSSMFAPCIGIESIGRKAFPCSINNSYSISDYNTISDASGYVDVIKM